MPGFVDMHVHMFPLDVIKNQEKYCSLDSCFGLLANPASTLQRYATAEEAIDAADEAGIEKLVMQGWYWLDQEICKYHNDYMIEILTKYPHRFEAFASVNPKTGDKALWEIERCHENGFIGVGEMGPGGQGFELDDPDLKQVMKAAENLNLLVDMHVGEPVGRIYPGRDFTRLMGFYNLVKEFPNLKFIFAHWGGGLPFYELKPEVKSAFRNVYYESAASPLLYETRVFSETARLVGAEKVLYGSDFPLILYPRKQKDADFTIFLEDIKTNAGLGEEDFRLVMRENALKLIAGAGKNYF